MQRLIIVDDYTDFAVWDFFLYTVLPTLPNIPKEYVGRAEVHAPEGNWTVAYAMHPHAHPNAYVNAGVPRPEFSQLPAVFWVEDSGVVTCRLGLRDRDQFAAFVRELVEKHTEPVTATT